MNEKLQKILDHYLELEKQLGDPANHADAEKLAKISKEKSGLENDAAKIKRYFFFF